MMSSFCFLWTPDSAPKKADEHAYDVNHENASSHLAQINSLIMVNQGDLNLGKKSRVPQNDMMNCFDCIFFLLGERKGFTSRWKPTVMSGV